MRFIVALFASLLFTGCAVADSPPEDLAGPHKVLFVGNSFTYYNNSLHNHYRALLRRVAPNREGRAGITTISGARLPEHAGGLPSILMAKDWDVVVLQGHSRGPIEGPTAEPFREAARDFAVQIRKVGAEPVFFMTWAYAGKPEMTKKLAEAYNSIAEELGTVAVPVGLAFATATRERPDIDLLTADGRHPSLAGTYLAACTFFAALHGVSPVGNDYVGALDPEVSTYLQQVAWRTVTR